MYEFAKYELMLLSHLSHLLVSLPPLTLLTDFPLACPLAGYPPLSPFSSSFLSSSSLSFVCKFILFCTVSYARIHWHTSLHRYRFITSALHLPADLLFSHLKSSHLAQRTLGQHGHTHARTHRTHVYRYIYTHAHIKYIYIYIYIYVYIKLPLSWITCTSF
jgi:hypothetical protein